MKSLVATTKSALEKEAKRVTDLLKGKTVTRVWRYRANEVGIEFEDGTTLFIDKKETGFELSII